MGSGWVEETPRTKSGKWFTLFYALVGSLLIYHAMGDLAAIPLAIRESRFQAQVLSQWGEQLTPRKLRSLLKRAHEVENHTTVKPSAVPEVPVNGKDKVSKRTVNRDEFVLSMLLLMGKVSMADIRECQKVFGKFHEILSQDVRSKLSASCVRYEDHNTCLHIFLKYYYISICLFYCGITSNGKEN